MFQEFSSSSVFYKTANLIAESPNSWVYKAFRVDAEGVMAQPVVLKVLKSRKMDQLWKKEFESLAKVKTNHCVRVLGFERLSGLPTLVLEPLDGLNGEELISQILLNGKLVIGLINQIFRGLCELEDHQLFHGDLSPTNLILTDAGLVKLIDYGMANGRNGQQVMTTIAYAAPEVLAGKSPNLETDLYSLGMLLQLWLTAIPIDDPLRGCLQALSSKLINGQDASKSNLIKRFLADNQSQQMSISEIKEVMQSALTVKRLKNQSTAALCLSSGLREDGSWFNLLRNISSLLIPLNFCRSFIVRGHSICVVALLMFIFTVAGAAQKDALQSSRYAQINLRTHQWVELTLMSGEKWTSPGTYFLAPGQHRLAWRSQSGKGQTTLTVALGEHILVTDHDDLQVAGVESDSGRVIYLGDLSGAN